MMRPCTFSLLLTLSQIIQFGFQRENPVSDIRGGGVLCIRQLIYFLEHHSAAAAQTLQKQKEETHSRASVSGWRQQSKRTNERSTRCTMV
jgi:hypothetical protein